MHTKPERPPTVNLFRSCGLDPDPWQVEVLENRHRQILLNCCRQSGKSSAVAMLALAEAVWHPLTRVIIISASHRQSRELFGTMKFFYGLLREPLKERVTMDELEMKNLSRIICLPSKEATIRGYSKIDFVIIDEAARVSDDVYRALRPMLAVSRGRLICLSTPFGRRGFFYKEWATGGDDWHRIEIPAGQCPRISAEFLEGERRAMGASWFRQEYECSFEAVEGVVYPDFGRCVVTELPSYVPDVTASPEPAVDPVAAARAQRYWSPPTEQERALAAARRVGGLDFGFRNPFAAVWGVVDRDDVLWLTGEHYAAEKPLVYHAEHLPRGLMWYADPSGADAINELIRANFKVRQGMNNIQLGIMAVRARLENGKLKVLKGRCPNLLREAGLYRWGDDGENPVDAHNHALAALRYLIASVDERYLARVKEPPPAELPPASEATVRSLGELLEDERLWPEAG